MSISSIPDLVAASGAASPQLLQALKALKNSIIGNISKKVQVAADAELLSCLLSLLEEPSGPDAHMNGELTVDILSETAVIIGSLANVGTLTLHPLLSAQTPQRLLHTINTLISLPSSSTPSHAASKALAPLLKALRNVLVSTADLVWGHMWGVGVPVRVVATGLNGTGTEPEDVVSSADKADRAGKRGGKGKSVDNGADRGQEQAQEALGIVFEDNNLSTLLHLIHTQTDTQILLPLYQLLSRLIALPSHRSALARWEPSILPDHISSRPRHAFLATDPSSTSTFDVDNGTPYILVHLLETIFPSPTPRRVNPKLLEAALDLLAALVKGQPELARCVSKLNSLKEGNGGMDVDEEGIPGVLGQLTGMLTSGSTGVRIAAASCLTNIVKADKTGRATDRIRSDVVNLQLLDVVVKLLQGEAQEERIKVCFVLAALVSDDAHLQRVAGEQGCPKQLLDMLSNLDGEEARGEIGTDAASRSREATLLALASLSFQNEPTRSCIAEYTPPFLPSLALSLSHPSYGVRAAACQLARALSRSLGILRTNLEDSGVADAVIELLKREVGTKRRSGVLERAMRVEPTYGSRGAVTTGGNEGEEGNERQWTVEVAATGTICNFVADFAPSQKKFLFDGGLELVVSLTHIAYEPLALNALWAIKNLTYRSPEGTKSRVVLLMDHAHMKQLLAPVTPTALRSQGLQIMQNVLADVSQAELNRTVEAFGEADVLDLVQAAAVDRSAEIKVPALCILANLALGNERMRQAIVSRTEIVEALSDALSAKSDPVRLPAIRTLRHLLEASTRSRRPRQAIVEVFQPYQLKSRLGELADSPVSFDVRNAAAGLLEVLDRGRGESAGAAR